jgi:hypothetical protein
MLAEGAGLLSDELIDLLGRLLAGSQSPPTERHVESLLRELRTNPTLHRPLNLRVHMQHAMKDETHMTVSTALGLDLLGVQLRCCWYGFTLACNDFVVQHRAASSACQRRGKLKQPSWLC